MDSKTIVINEIKKLTKNTFDVTSNIKDLKIDSLDLVLFITDIEEKYHITISDEELLSLKTIQNIIDLFDKKLNK
ncbi:phosphopantetheine-binding protein [Metamycoplasma buccale]|uniref:phosphopantetheine-binding protein n=1 Tax=Metamycoplasma buccale TaxID=55602 RepID=UPI00398F70E7